jgi:hypothetical protein
MRDAIGVLVCVLGIALLLWWADIPRAFDQDMGLYKKHHVNAVKCVIE